MTMNIVYFSKGVRGSRCLAYILEAGYDVKAVVGVSREGSLEEIGRQYDFPLLFPEILNTAATVRQLEDFDPDLFILCGYNKILKPLIIDIPPLGTINLHGGKLPEYRGAAPINWQIINGESSGGCSIIYVDEGIDTGDILAQELYPILPDDTHASVLEKTLHIFPALLGNVLWDIQQGTAKAVPQNPHEGAYFTRRYPRDSRIFWERMTDIQVHNLVRGMHGPYPAAFSYRADIKVEFDRTELLEEDITGTPGRVPLKRGSSAIVLAQNRGILVHEIRVQGKNISPAEFFTIGDDLY